MKWNAKAPMVPLAEDGSLLHYPDNWLHGKTWDWVLWEPFWAPMEFIGFQRGRSAAYAILKRNDGPSYPMFLTDFESLLLSSAGVQEGWTGSYQWHVTKRGQNYGLRLV